MWKNTAYIPSVTPSHVSLKVNNIKVCITITDEQTAMHPSVHLLLILDRYTSALTTHTAFVHYL